MQKSGRSGFILLDILCVVVILIALAAGLWGLYLIHPLWLYIPLGVILVGGAAGWIIFRCVQLDETDDKGFLK